MKFSRVGEHTIKCVISEEEIFEMGYTMDEIMSNGAKTQEFMNYIFDLAEQEFQVKFDMGVKTVRADFLPDHTLLLTFSEHPISSMMEHLKDVFDGILNSMPKEKLEELKQNSGLEISEDEDEDIDESIRVVVLFAFADSTVLETCARLIDVSPVPPNELYKYHNHYIITMDLSDCTEPEVLRLSVLMDEFGAKIEVGADKRAFLKEHAKVLLKDHAIEQLRSI
jgi:adapter protein MecA 1/2